MPLILGAAAQEVAPPGPGTVEADKRDVAGSTLRHIVPLRYVAARTMAWMIDAGHNPEPPEFAEARVNALKHGGAEGKAHKIARTTTLPEGVQKIVPLEQRQALLVLGTVQGAAAVKELVRRLDIPAQQIEIEAVFVEISADDAKEFTLEGAADAQVVRGTHPARYRLAHVRNYAATLERLGLARRAKVLQRPRLTTFENLAANLAITRSIPAIIGAKDETGTFKPLYSAMPGSISANLHVSTTSSVIARPTLNADESIGLQLELSKLLLLTRGFHQEESIRLDTPLSVSAIATVRDGETLALTGLASDVWAPHDSPLRAATATAQAVTLSPTPPANAIAPGSTVAPPGTTTPAVPVAPPVSPPVATTPAVPANIVLFVTVRKVSRGGARPLPGDNPADNAGKPR